MTTDQASIKCPKCLGGNVTPREEIWYCQDCNQYFDTAAVKLPEPGPPVRKQGKRAPK